jgi:hypothetical protein
MDFQVPTTCKCRGKCRCGQSIKENFTDEEIAKTPVYDACTSSSRQSTYYQNMCAVYKNMVKPILDSVEDDPITYNKIGKAYTDLIVNSLMPREGQSYTQKYDEILNAFVALERTFFNILSTADRQIPDGYAFIIPDAISVADYAPGVATWEAAALQPKSFKCALFTATELDSLERLKNRPNRAGAGTSGQQLYGKAQANICSSKGYYYNDGTFESKGCTDCIGCCVPSNEDLNGSGSAVVCPRPKVRPFQIPPRRIRLRIVPPNLKKDLECYTNYEPSSQAMVLGKLPTAYVRDVHDITKSEKFISMQLGR